MLKYLNDKVEQVITQIESVVPTESALAEIGHATPVNLCGFEVPEDLVQEDRRVRYFNSRLARIKVYRDDALKLRNNLKAIDIEPIAVITAKAFDRLVAEMGLFTLRPSQSGAVEINRQTILALKPSESQRLLSNWIAAILGGGAYIAAFSQWGWGTQLDGYLVGAAFLLCAVAFVSAALSEWCFNKTARRSFARRAKAFVASLSWEQLLVELSHGKTRWFYSPNWENENNIFQRKLMLPPAPTDVIEKVCRIARANQAREEYGNTRCRPGELWIAAEAGAISFKDGIESLFDLKAIEAHLEMERRIAADPILYIRGCEHGAVAIIAQYGDPPDERETIDRIVASEHLL